LTVLDIIILARKFFLRLNETYVIKLYRVLNYQNPKIIFKSSATSASASEIDKLEGKGGTVHC
jgi:hypothetical protein